MRQTQPQTRSYLQVAIALVAGALFAIGLALAGMTQPSKVIGFLDVAGDWDPSLALVMAGGVSVFFVANRFARRRAAPLAGERFYLPTRHQLDPRLLTGAALFGVGWGLAGYCPGPGLTSLASGSSAALTFVLAMLGGMLLFDQLSKSRGRKANQPKAQDRSLPGDSVFGEPHN